jgi:hypothetical protein
MKAAIIIVFVGVLLVDSWVFFIRPRKPLREKLSFLFQVVATYTFAFGLLAQTKLLATFGTLAQDMTSPNLFEFLRGNFAFLALLFSGLATALEPIKEAYGPLYILEMFVLLIGGLLTLVYAVFHLLVIVPFTYLAYMLVAVPINAIVTSASDMAFAIGGQTISIKSVVTENVVSFRNFTIAVPAMSLALTSKMVDLIRQGKGNKNDGAV